jgi:hypothetical protein
MAPAPVRMENLEHGQEQNQWHSGGKKNRGPGHYSPFAVLTSFPAVLALRFGFSAISNS